MIELKTEKIGIVVKRLRKELGLSQEVCSGLAGIARSHLAMIENASKIPNFETSKLDKKKQKTRGPLRCLSCA